MLHVGILKSEQTEVPRNPARIGLREEQPLHAPRKKLLLLTSACGSREEQHTC